jgi:hypothetical protein
MTDTTSTDEAIAELRRQVSELSGLSLATGVLLTQLLQSMTLKELSPQRAATKIISNAREAVEGFTSMPGHADPVMKARALDAVEQYETQIRSVLPV